MTYLGLGGDNFALTNSLALGSHGERVLQVLAKDDVLDEHALNLDTPAGGDILNDFTDGLSNLFTALDDVLQDTSTDNVAQSGLSTLNESLADVGDAKGGLMGRDDVIVNDGSEAQSDIVLGHTRLLRYLGDLDLDINLNETLTKWVDLDQAWIDGLVEAAELSDETDVALVNILVGVGTDDAARKCTHCSNNGTEGVDYSRAERTSQHNGVDGRRIL